MATMGARRNDADGAFRNTNDMAAVLPCLLPPQIVEKIRAKQARKARDTASSPLPGKLMLSGTGPRKATGHTLSSAARL